MSSMFHLAAIVQNLKPLACASSGHATGRVRMSCVASVSRVRGKAEVRTGEAKPRPDQVASIHTPSEPRRSRWRLFRQYRPFADAGSRLPGLMPTSPGQLEAGET